MNKAYQKLTFVNNQEPDLDAENLNSISNAIDTIDDRVVALDGQSATLSGQVDDLDKSVSKQAEDTKTELDKKLDKNNPTATGKLTIGSIEADSADIDEITASKFKHAEGKDVVEFDGDIAIVSPTYGEINVGATFDETANVINIIREGLRDNVDPKLARHNESIGEIYAEPPKITIVNKWISSAGEVIDSSTDECLQIENNNNNLLVVDSLDVKNDTITIVACDKNYKTLDILSSKMKGTAIDSHKNYSNQCASFPDEAKYILIMFYGEENRAVRLGNTLAKSAKNADDNIENLIADVSKLEVSVITDTADYYIEGATDAGIYGIDIIGHSTQDGEPSPDNIVPISFNSDISARTLNIADAYELENDSNNNNVAIYTIPATPSTQYSFGILQALSKISYIIVDEFPDFESEEYLASKTFNTFEELPYTFTTNVRCNCIKIHVVSKSWNKFSEKDINAIGICLCEGEYSYSKALSNSVNTGIDLYGDGTFGDELIISKNGSAKIIRRYESILVETNRSVSIIEVENTRFIDVYMHNIHQSHDESLPCFCEKLKFKAEKDFFGSGAGCFFVGGNEVVISVPDSVTDANAKQYLEEQQFVITYPLYEDYFVEEKLTAQQVARTLRLQTYSYPTVVESEMTIKSVEFAKDTKKYIDDADESLDERVTALESRPSGSASLVLTSASPLNASSAGSILGLDAKGKSTQNANAYDGSYTLGKTVQGYSSANRSVSNLIPIGQGVHKVKANNLPSNVWYGIFEFPANAYANGKELVSSVTDKNERTFTIESGYPYFCVYFGTVDNSAMTDSMFNSVSIYVEGTPTPTNPIPIVDASEEVTAIGRNLCNPNTSTTFDVNGSGAYRVGQSFKGGKSYYVYVNDSSIAYYQIFNANGTYKGSGIPLTNNSIKVDVASDEMLVVRRSTSSGTIGNGIYVGLVDGDYVPYASNTITLPYTLRSVGTVADELIVNKDGSGQIVRRVGTVDLSTFSYSYTANWNNYHIFNTQAMIGIAKIPTNNNDIANIMCDRFKATSRNIIATESQAFEGEMAINTGGTLMLGTNAYSSVDAFKSAMSGVMLYYELATPTTETLTAEEVASILALQTYNGTTIIESEMQIDSVTYSGDVKGYVDSKTDYSYTDQIIGKWADGEDLHRMVIQTTTPSALNASILVSNLVKPSLHNIKRFDGTIVASPYVDGLNMFINNDYHIATFINQDGVMMNISNNIYANKPCEIIVEYTLKDTATASVMSLSLDDEGGEE